MKPITELLSLYEDFFGKLSSKINTNDAIVRSEEFENPTDEEIDAFATQFNANIPDVIRTFWKSLKHTYEASVYSDVEWSAGWDFVPVGFIERDTPMLRNLANNYEDNSYAKKIHETGVQLTYEEPILLFDANKETKTGSIHFLLWDGTSLPEAIAPDFNTFFEHWLAAGCFRGRNFKAYWEIVKGIVPIQIPLKENLWIRYYSKQYNEVLV